MATTTFEKDIAVGIRNAVANPVEFGTPIRLRDHPNRKTEVAEMKGFTVTRQTMDPSQGIDGFVSLSIRAVNAAEARLIADETVAVINEPFIQRERTSRR